MHNKQLVLFDIDGTLLHPAGCGRAATVLAMREVFGTAGVLDQVNFAGKTDWQILLEALQPAGFARETVQAHLDPYDQTVARILDEIIGGFPLKPCAGALDAIAALRSDPGVLVGLVTGNMQGLVSIKLQTAGFDPADFKIGAYGSEGWERSMLPPLALRRAREYSGHDFAPEQIVIIGDTPGDVACAESIGARTIAVATGPFNIEQLRACQPSYTFETLSDTGMLLEAIFQSQPAS